MDRQSKVETLERRELLAAEILDTLPPVAHEAVAHEAVAHAVFEPGTSQDVIDQWEHDFHEDESSSEHGINTPGSRWTNPSGGASADQGDGATVSWSIVPDGTVVAGSAGPAGSDLIAFLDGIYGGTGSTVETKPWFPLFEKAFDDWSAVSGLNFVFEPNDDGLDQGAAGATGETGVRGDHRIGGADITSPGVLAYNFFPGNSAVAGDMVIDTASAFYQNNANGPNGENRGLHNVLMHEIGHGIGLGHVAPVNQSKLMEPTVTQLFSGPQHDDILAVQNLYGDRFSDNDLRANPTDLGPVTDQSITVEGVSIDANSDVDWYSFDAEAGQAVSIAISPAGQVYQVQTIDGDGNTGPIVDSNSRLNSDLRLEVYDDDGTLVAESNVNPEGGFEFASALPITKDGTYTVGVFGLSSFTTTDPTDTQTQFYSLAVQQSALADPSLIAASPNKGELFDLDVADQASNVLTVAPTEVTLTFGGTHSIDPATLDAISVQYSESGNFADGNTVDIPIGFVALDDSGRNATIRFAENLKDGFFQISITNDLASQVGIPFIPRNSEPVPGDPTLVREVVAFEVELGAKVIAVVPQPIVPGTVNPDYLKQIEVYFDDADLFRAGANAGTAAFYQLVATQNTVTPEDDFVAIPTGVTLDAAARKVTLTFGAELDVFVAPGESLRLRIGDSVDFTAVTLAQHTPGVEPGLTSATASIIPVQPTGNWSTIVVGQEITNAGATGVIPMVDNVGAQNEPGHRDVEIENHFIVPESRDFDDEITVIEYTFLRNTPYAFNSQGDPLFNDMNAEQEQRFLEILDLYSNSLGIDFVETELDGLTLIVGDLATADPSTPSGPGGTAGLGGPGGVTMDALDFGNAESNQFGQGFFLVALHEIGHAIGLGHAYDLPPGTIQGGNGEYPDTERPGPNNVEWAFPGTNDTFHGLHLHQRESLDVDMYQVDIAEDGVLNIQTFAQRLPDATLLDTRLSLYRLDDAGKLILESSNDDYFGSDSFIEYAVKNGTYFVGVSSQGNSQFDPNSGLTAAGGTSEGAYELRVGFTTQASASITDADNSLLDGDRDGVAGGNYDFWFEPASAATTIHVDKTAPAGGSGTFASPYNNIPEAIAAAENRISTTSPDGVVVRLLANGGVDNDVASADDNLAYEVGFIDSLNDTLDDGRNLDLPAGVHLVVDAGVVMKFLDSRISVGSDDDGNDRSEGSISVQGTPELPVYFTSYNDRTLGSNSNILGTPAAAGNWGGIEIRSDVDRLQGRSDLQRQGIFQNYINHAVFAYGGGEVTTISRNIDPIHLSESRPEISYNTIQNSSGAAISADPNTFEVTTFAEPRFQQSSVSGVGFAADYDRLGPAIDGNTLTGNSTNGIFVRIDTPAGGGLETLSVTARFDDTDIVHVLGENLIIEGNPGGPVQLSTRPSPILGLAPQAGGLLAAGDYQYSYTFINALGNEGPASEVQTVTGVPAAGQVSLTNIPLATGDNVGRMLYRSTGGGDFALVAELDKTSRDYVDQLDVAPASAAVLDVTATDIKHGRPDGTLVIDPGLLIKNQGARIELGFGANLIAEGVEGREVILTARSDDSYGAGGTFDTNGDGDGSRPNAGDWAGIYASPTSRLSLDHAYVAFAGGVTGVNGGTASFNAVQIHQAEARIANSVFENNAGGTGATQGNARRDYAPNDDATIYVTNAQPTIVGNTIINNEGAAIGINVNSMSGEFVRDLGRQTGSVDQYETPPANQGPLLRGNRLDGNDINALEIRGEVLTTDVVWDDTDIVHLLNDDIEIPNFHTFGGMRIESSSTESLVVKADNAEILATGRSIDIPDRIGGRLMVLGQPGFPVVITSINDDTIGAGFTPDGSPQTDTVPGGGPSAGDWQGLKFDEYSHDRNVATVTEREGLISGFGDANANIGSDQDLGLLAANELSGDENIRLGFDIHGAIAADTDLDLYSFDGVAGTLVWFDIDRTDPGLDTVLELIDGNGRVLALSQDSRTESLNQSLTYTNTTIMRDGHALPMQLDQDAFTNVTGDYRDLYTTNDGDSGMRVVLPGTTGTRNTFYVRVRSANPASDYTSAAGIAQSVTDGGKTSGGYQLQVRLSETDEFAGSVVRYADLRYATSAIVAIGLPAHSPIAGDLFNPGGLLDLGSFSNTDRAALSVAGVTDTTPDSYVFTVERDSLQGLVPTDNRVSLMIDVDWSDGLTRPDTSAYLFDGTTLIAIGTDSNVADDRITPIVPGQPSLETDPSRGSLGGRDAYIGPLEVSPGGTYELVIAGPAQVPKDMEQFFLAGAANTLARLEPIDSTVRIIDDRFDYDPGNGANQTPVPTDVQGPEAIQVGFNDDGSNIIPFQFGDIPLITLREDSNGAGAARLSIYNPLTGRHDAIIEEHTSAPLGAIAQSTRGDILAIRNSGSENQNDANTSTTYTVSADGVLSQVGATGLDTYEQFFTDAGVATNRQVPNGGDGVEFLSLAYFGDTENEDRFLYGLANRGDFVGANVRDGADGANVIGGPVARNADNLIYRLDPDTGTAISRRGQDMPGGFQAGDPLDPELANAFPNNVNLPGETPWAGTNVIAQLQIPFVSPATGLDTGAVTSLVTDVANGDFLYAFTETGAVWQIEITTRDNDNNSYDPGDLRANAPAAPGDPSFPTLLVDPTVAVPVPGIDSITNVAGETLVFEQVTKGPANFLDAANDTVGLADMYFGVGRAEAETPDIRRFYAFDLATRTAQPVFAFGAESITVDDNQAAGEFAGFFFSPLDQSLWHLSDTLRGEAGHGFGELDDRPAVIGGGSLRFGFDALDDDFNHLSSQDADGLLGGILSNDIDGNNDLDAIHLQGFNGYNFIGGAHGSVQSNVLDLSGVADDDLPTLYFTYLLDTENTNADDTPPNFGADNLDDVMRDSLRVMIAGDDGIWRLAATNNIADGINDRVWEDSRGNVHEYDPIGSNGYTDIGDQRFVQELFDGDEFRQARIDLGPWAGQENVQIRFEFTTAGEARPDQSEVHAIPGDQIVDGQTLAISGMMPDVLVTNQGDALVDLTKVFEFDHGLVVQVPAGAQITTPTTLSGPGGVIVTLTQDPPVGPDEVQVFATDSASDVADRVEAFIIGNGGTVARSATNPALVAFTDEVTEGTYDLPGFTVAVVGRPGIKSTSTAAIPVTIASTDIEVRDAIQLAFATEIKYLDTAAPSLAAFPVVGQTTAVRVYDLSIRQNAPGIVESIPGNDDLATAQSLADELWSLKLDPNVLESTTRPHLTISGVGDGTYDYYSFTVLNPGDTATFDIDGGAFDTELHLYDDAGNALATDDDTSGDPGSTSFLDSFITHTFAAPGTYIIGVAAFESVADAGGITGAFVPNGGRYTLHVSLDGKPVESIATGRSFKLIQGENSGTSNTPGSSFGVYSGGNGLADLLRAGERSRGLGGANGVYLDDIVIGLADRGESFTGSNQGTTMVDDPYFEALFYDALSGTERPVVEELEVGPYQLEVRLGREYLGADNEGKDFRVGINERLAEAFNVEVVSGGTQLVDGDTFTLSNGFETLTFEFNDDTEPTLTTPVTAGNVEIAYATDDTAAEIADRIRLAINSDSVRSVLGIHATTAGGELNSDTDPTIFMHGYAAATNVGGVSFTSPESGATHLVGEVTGYVPFLLGEDNGDSNRHRDQGVFIVDSNVVSFASGTAIDISAGSTAPGNKVPEEGNRPKPGATANLATLSTEGLVHGAVVQNNLLISNGNGIRLSGNADEGGPAVYSRILNNTIYNSDIGIDIAGTAAPTLLNNVLVDNNIGIRGAGSGPRVVRATVFDGNGQNTQGITAGTEAIINPIGPLFVNTSDANFGLAAGNPNFYPAAGSVLIDSSIESQLDRNSIVAVKDELGIPRSPIVVTQRDLAGQIRGNGSTNGGQGQNIDIDRGALDRSDVLGPTATIISPADNDVDFVDVDRGDTFLQLTSGVYNFFEILIGDGSGVGPDQSTITADQVALFENGRRLVAGSEFTHAYNVANRTLRLTPAAGIWRPDAVYEIVMLNELLTLADGSTIPSIADLAGNNLRANRGDGQTRFTIVMPEVDLDFGDSLDNYRTAFGTNGARHAIVNDGSPRLGQYIDGESDWAGSEDSDDLNSNIFVDGNIRQAGDGPFTVVGDGTASLTLTLNSLPSLGDNISVTAGDGTAVFELVEIGGTVAVGSIPVEYPTGASIEMITELLANAMAANLPARNVLAVAEHSVGTPVITLEGQDDEDGVGIGSFDFGGSTLDHVFIDPTTGELISFLNPLATEGSEVLLTVQGTGFIDAWVDFNGDGDFEDSGERVLVSEPVVDGVNSLFLITPVTAAVANNANELGTTRARFRISSDGNLTSDGLAVDGEVEDYTVTVAKAAVPIALDDNFGINEDQTLNSTVMGNDSEEGASNVVYEIVSNPDHGTLVSFDSTNGTFEYVPDADYYGEDAFTYRIVGVKNVGASGAQFPVRSRTAMVSLAITPVNDAPSSLPQVITGLEDENVTFTNADFLLGAMPHPNSDTLIAPFNEAMQSLIVVNINVIDDTGALAPVVTQSDVADPFSIADGTYSAETHIEVSPSVFQPFGTLTVTVATDGVSGITEVTSVTFAPEISVDTGTVDALGAPVFKTVRLDNYNRNSPAPVTFQYVVGDDAVTFLEDGTDVTSSMTRETFSQAATIVLLEQNDVPVLGNDVIVTQEDPGTLSIVIPFATLLANDVAGAKVDVDGLNESIDENNGTNDIMLGMPTLVQGSLVTGSNDFIVTTAGGFVQFEPSDPTQFLYTPPTDFYGLDSFSYSVTDLGDNVSLDATGVEQNVPSMLTSTATVVLDVQPQNDLPSTPDKPTSGQALVDIFTTVEDPASPMVITANSLTADSLGHANPTYRGNPFTTFNPAPIAPQDESNQTFFVTGVFDKDDVEITIAEVGDPTDPDTFETPFGTFRPFFDTTAGETFGRLIQIEYTPDPDFNSAQDLGAGLVSVPDTFAFTLSDDGKSVDQRPNLDINGNPFAPYVVTPASIKAMAAITVTPVNDAPVLMDDTFATSEDVPLTIPLSAILANDVVGPDDESSGINDGALIVDRSPITTTEGGTVTFLGNGDLRYTPAAEFSGQDSFVYSASDRGITEDANGNRIISPESASANVIINVAGVNDPPTINQPNSVTMSEDEVGRIAAISGITAGGSENQMIRVTAVSSDPSPFDDLSPIYISPENLATIPLTPRDSAFGITTVTVTATDAGFDGVFDTADDASTSRDFIVRVNAVNDLPTIAPIADASVVENDVVADINLEGITAGPAESQPLSVTVTSSNTSLVRNEDIVVDYTSPSDTGSFSYSLQTDQAGTTTFTVTVTDGGLDGDLATTADNGSTTESFVLTVDEFDNVPTLDPIGDLLIEEEAAEQTVELIGIAGGPSQTGDLTITATSSNPTLIPDPTVSYTPGASTATLQYTPAANQFGLATITVTVTDAGPDGDLATTGDNGVKTESFTVTVTNTVDVPTPVDDELSGDEDSVVSIGAIDLIANDIAPDLLDGQQLSLILDADNPDAATQTITTALGATVTFNSGSGELTYDPGTATQLQSLGDGESVEDSFLYFVNDGTLSDPLPSATVRLTIEGINDAPTVLDDVAESPSVPANPLTMDPIIITPLTNDFDVDGTLDLNSLIVTEEPLFGSVSRRLVDDGNGNQVVELAFSPFANFAGSDSFKYTVSDNLGQQSAEATIQIQPTRKPTTGEDVGGGVAADGISIDVLANDVAVVGSLDLTSLTISTNGNNGTATANADGTVSYVPNDGFIGTDSFEYTIADTEGNVSEPVRVVVNSVANGTQNPIRYRDVNDDGDVTALDALLIVNLLGRMGSNNVPVDGADRGPNYYDVNGSGDVTSLDALLVVNRIGQAASVFEGERVMEPLLVAPSTSLPSNQLPTVALPSTNDQSLSSSEEVAADGEIGILTGPGTQAQKLTITDKAVLAGDRVDDTLVDLLAADADSEALETVSEESATDLAFKWLR